MKNAKCHSVFNFLLWSSLFHKHFRLATLKNLQAALGFKIVRTSHSGVHLYFHCTGSYICAENCGFAAPRVKGSAAKTFHVCCDEAHYPVFFRDCPASVSIYNEYTFDSSPILDFVDKESCNRIFPSSLIKKSCRTDFTGHSRVIPDLIIICNLSIDL